MGKAWCTRSRNNYFLLQVKSVRAWSLMSEPSIRLVLPKFAVVEVVEASMLYTTELFFEAFDVIDQRLTDLAVRPNDYNVDRSGSERFTRY
jgi:hypothetical protein